MIRAITIAAVTGATLALAVPAGAQSTATPAQAFGQAIDTVCVKNAFGQLPMNPPSAALSATGVQLVDGGTDPDVRGAFHDMPVTIIYGAMPSASGQIVIGADDAGSCRVAAINVAASDVDAIRAALAAQADGWNPIANDADEGSTTYSGTIEGQSAMVEVTVPPAGSHWGKAGILVTVMNPAAGG